ncbi:long-chain-fatty-acid--CoA ligase 4-like [Oppia nitens]|uniref:long-chain-fatty-acid--CoA ligase 4-like n=1 Tax=Oppia nitens TaxID=1686743 RepID=UPI0023DB091F|nr:long-chain-fatty-acid--CoA ligase 4-like [Oppia nitens]
MSTETTNTNNHRRSRPSPGLIAIKCLVILYDVITFPIYYLIQRPWIRLRKANRVRSEREDPNDLHSPYVRTGQRVEHYVTKCQTIPEAQRMSLEKNGRNRPALGFREILGEEGERQSNGKVFMKWRLTDYQWLTIGDVDDQIGDIARGLLTNGVKPKDTVLILADTRLEWFLSAQAIVRIGASIATLYVSLGDDGLIHGINETEVKHIITTQDMLAKLAKMKTKIPLVNTVIYIEGPKALNGIDFGDDIKLVPFKEMVSQGQAAPKSLVGVDPTPDDVAVILYTSGSTGTPKGVVLTHKNFMASVSSVLTILDHKIIRNADKHRFMAYLPLAHSLEFCAETFFFSVGVRMGYGTANTLMDSGTAIRRGDKGDLTLLKPTIMPSVPLILDRIRKGVFEVMEKRGQFTKELFNYALNYKAYWRLRGMDTPIVNKLFCSKVRAQVGGELDIMIVGGAPLSPETQKIMQAALNCKLLQGFGSTETSAASIIMDFDDMSYGKVGAPLFGIKTKMIDWPEGGYRVTDKPYPRGELIIGGDHIATGYYKLDKQTEEEFEDKDGLRWFTMGDIAEVDEKGVFKIIDRKKDLVKLQFGEYISLGKVEAELKNSRLVDNVCVYGDSMHSNLVALVLPNAKSVRKLAQELDLNQLNDKPLPELYDDRRVMDAVLKELIQFAVDSRLHKMEIPTKVKLVSEEWTPANDLITAALKLKRKNIQNFYQKDIDAMYGKSSPVSNNNHINNNNNVNKNHININNNNRIIAVN